MVWGGWLGIRAGTECPPRDMSRGVQISQNGRGRIDFRIVFDVCPKYVQMTANSFDVSQVAREPQRYSNKVQDRKAPAGRFRADLEFPVC